MWCKVGKPDSENVFNDPFIGEGAVLLSRINEVPKKEKTMGKRGWKKLSQVPLEKLHRCIQDCKGKATPPTRTPSSRCADLTHRTQLGKPKQGTVVGTNLYDECC